MSDVTQETFTKIRLSQDEVQALVDIYSSVTGDIINSRAEYVQELLQKLIAKGITPSTKVDMSGTIDFLSVVDN